MRFRVPPLDRTLEGEIRAAIDGKTKPRGALGRLESLALQIGLVQGSVRPRLALARVTRVELMRTEEGVQMAGFEELSPEYLEQAKVHIPDVLDWVNL